jgi:hypothetical protein
MDDEQRRRETLDRVEKSGRDRFGEAWPEMLSSLGRCGAAASVAQIVGTPDAVDRISIAAREALLFESNSEDTTIARNASRVYSDLRTQDRERHRRMKGRA